jgi:hypothetical protein
MMNVTIKVLWWQTRNVCIAQSFYIQCLDAYYAPRDRKKRKASLSTYLNYDVICGFEGKEVNKQRHIPHPGRQALGRALEVNRLWPDFPNSPTQAAPSSLKHIVSRTPR